MLTDILEIDQPTLQKMYDFTINTNGNIIIFGPAGIGKTEMAIQSAKHNNIKYVYVNLSVLEAPDMVGLPRIGEDVTTYAPPEFLPLADKGEDPVILILDEIDKAKEELQNPMLELFQFRSINGRALAIKAILATGNLPDERAFSRKISHALTNRCMVYQVRSDFDAWRKWALEANINSLVLGFLERNQGLLLDKAHSDDPTAYANPSPRSWAWAAKDLDSLDFREFSKLNSEESDIDNAFINFQFKIVAGRVGHTAAFKFKTWLKYYRVLEPLIDVLVEDGERPENLTSDSIMIFTIAALSKMRLAISSCEPAKKLDYANRVFGWMNDDVPPEFCLSAMKCTVNTTFLRAHGLLDCEALNEIFDEIEELVL